MFSWEFRQISKNTFFTEHLGTTASAQNQPLGVFYEKRCSWKLRKSHRKTPLACDIFKNIFFNRTPLDDCFWLFRAMLLKWGTDNNVWKTSDEYSLPRNTWSTVQIYHFFFQQDKLSVYVFIGLHCLLPEVAIRVEVFCEKNCS